MLGRGQVGLDLTLRHVAQELDVALSTVTYAYPNVTELLDDLTVEHNANVWRFLREEIGNQGFAVEMQRMASRYYLYAMHEPARLTLML